MTERLYQVLGSTIPPHGKPVVEFQDRFTYESRAIAAANRFLKSRDISECPYVTVDNIKTGETLYEASKAATGIVRHDA